MQKRMFEFRYPRPAAEEVVAFYREHFGPVRRAFERLEPSGQAALRDDLETLWTVHNPAQDGTVHTRAEVLEVVVSLPQASGQAGGVIMKPVFLSFVLAGLASLAPLHGMDAGRENPRAYCTRTGGQIQETGHPSVYICCYPDRQKCLAIDTEQRLSWIVPLQPQHTGTIKRGVPVQQGSSSRPL